MLCTLEVEVSEVSKFIENVFLIVYMYICILYIFAYKFMTLKFSQAQITCAIFCFDTCFFNFLMLLLNFMLPFSAYCAM